jgi:uncharacterized RDD family membrane protein YckC
MESEYRVLTPESVEFVYELGGLGSRMLAVLLDHLIVLGVLGALWAVVLVGGCMTFFLALPLVALAMAASFLVYFGYFTWFEWRWSGQTPGKRLLDLRVIDDRGMNIDFFQAAIRNLFRIVDMMPALFALDYLAVGFYAVGGLTALASRSHRRIGDWAAGTLVVRTRKRVLPSAIMAPNEKYNTLQEDASLRSRIRSRLSLQEREALLQLCLRRNELEFESRQALFADAAAYLERKLEIRREEFLSEEKFVQNITAVALAGAVERREERVKSLP